MSKKPTKPYVDAINYGKYEKTNKCIYSLRGSKTLAWQASRLLCEETGEGGGLKMDVYLVPPSVFTDVKCNPGTLPDSMPHELHCIIMLTTTPQITLGEISSRTKVWILISSLFQDGYRPQSLDTA